MNRSIFPQAEEVSVSGDDQPCLAFYSQGEKDVIEWVCVDFSWIMGQDEVSWPSPASPRSTG